jgi:hypothetical protein
MSERDKTKERFLCVGDPAYDVRKGVLCVVMAVDGVRYWLRRPAGGIEWDARREDVRPATTAERLSPALAERNARSEAGRAWGAGI